MSDGPYRSLPMSRSWKRLAKFAENLNFGDTDMSAAAMDALKRTWRKDVPDSLMAGICKIFLEPQSGLFANHRIEDVEALSDLAAGHSIGRLLIEHAVNVVQEGRIGEAGLIEAAQRTLLACGARASRQIEEHYLREARPALTQLVRERVWKALSEADRRTLARLLFGLKSRTARQPLPKQNGLEDGVPL